MIVRLYTRILVSPKAYKGSNEPRKGPVTEMNENLASCEDLPSQYRHEE